MTVTSVHDQARRASENYDIHDATCRAKRQGLACSTCIDLRARVEAWAEAERLMLGAEAA